MSYCSLLSSPKSNINILARIPSTSCVKIPSSACKCVLIGPEGKCPAESAGCDALETCTALENTICKSIPTERCETVETTHVQDIPFPFFGK